MDGQRVLELGAGCGLAGIAAAKYHQWSELISTDFDHNVLRQLRSNFELNFDEQADSNRVEYCDWTNLETIKELASDFDLVIAAG